MRNGESLEGVHTHTHTHTHTGTLLNRSKNDLFNKNRNNINSTCIYNNYIINFSRNNNSNIKWKEWINRKSKTGPKRKSKRINNRISKFKVNGIKIRKL